LGGRLWQKRKKEGHMETSKPREPLSAEEKERFNGYTAAIFSRLGMNLDSPGGTGYAAEMAGGSMGYDRRL
jgi:hypothetical protein